MASEESLSVDKQEIVRRFQEQRNELTQLMSKITEIEQEKNEHTLVLSTLEPLDPQRKCYRMVGDILVKRTVGEVLPVVSENNDQLNELLSSLRSMFERKQKLFAEYQQKYNIRVQS